MSNPVIEELIKYYESQGLTLEEMSNMSESDWKELPGQDGNPLNIIPKMALKAKAKQYKDSKIPSISSASQIRIKQLEEEKEALLKASRTKFIELEKLDKVKVEKSRRKVRISEFISFAWDITTRALRDVQKMISDLKVLGTTLDICFCIDGTGSMGGIINSVKQCIVQVSDKISLSTGMNCRFALVVYRDYCDGEMRTQVWDFTDSSALSSYLGEVNAYGGGDTSEDCFGGLLASIERVRWASPSKAIVWMGDAPQHGTEYNGGFDDSHSAGDPSGVTTSMIFKKLNEKNIVLVFCKLASFTDAMIAQMKLEVVPYGDNIFLQYNLEGDMATFLTITMHTTASMTAGYDSHKHHKLGKEKDYTLTHATWKIDPLWNTEEECKILSFKAFDGGDMHPLLDLLMDGAGVSERKSKINITNNPFEKGEMRLAYLGKITEKGGYFKKEVKKGVVKESRYEGRHNSRKVLIDQAHVQAVAQFMAEEFTIALKNISVTKKVMYVPVEILHIPSRSSGKNYFSLEPYLEGKYIKFNNNNGFVNKEIEAMHPLLQTFTHFTYHYTSGILMVVDVQGVINDEYYKLTDPAIHTADSKKILRDPTNLGTGGMSAFFASHVCNRFCQILKLKRPEELDTSTPMETSRKNGSLEVIDEEEAWSTFEEEA
ncbi:hypothetical protein SteCoe_38688 [Stentor coeruleus]|uniref:Alpha-type protein kinase domain-containing protein n=1 Tax=Stentor coeruleus TaxID=5963 RepID=A0A1R2ALE8_9CILI|nr:hypothetical protein SteCoe_38688 [Stentor coeruleus]